MIADNPGPHEMQPLTEAQIREAARALSAEYSRLVDAALITAADQADLARAQAIARLRLLTPFRDFVIANKEPVYFKLDEDMGSAGVVYFKLRLIVNPSLLRNNLGPSLVSNARIAIP